MIQVNSPGLPPWPPLRWDEAENKAVVNVRHATWRSFEWSYYLTEALVWAGKIAIVLGVWHTLPIEGPAYRVFATLGLIIILFPIASYVTRTALRGAIARQLFPTMTRVWVTADAIIFSSRIFTQPVVIWRHWKGLAVKTRFIIQPDAEANRYLRDQPQRKLPRGPLEEAALIEAVVATPNEEGSLMSAGQHALQKSIPLTETSNENARKIATVFSAAILLVDSRASQTNKTKPATGIDIDAG